MHGPTFAPAPPAAVTAPPKPRPARPAVKPAPAAGGGANLVLVYLRLHWLTVLFTGSLVGAGLGYAAYSLIPNKYESYTLIQVSSAPFTFAGGADPSKGQTAFATYIKTMRGMIKTELVLNAALNDPARRIDKLPTLAGQPDAVRFLEEKLVVESAEGSETIRVSLEGDRPEDLKPIVDAVKDAFNSQVVEKDIANKKATLEQLELTKQKYDAHFRTLLGPGNGSRTSFAPPTAEAAAPPVPDVVQVGATASGPALTAVPASLSVPAAAAGVLFTESPEFKKAAAQRLMDRVDDLERKLGEYPQAIKRAETEAAARRRALAAAAPPDPSPAALADAEKDPAVAHKLAVAAVMEREAQHAYGVARDKGAAAVRHAAEQAAAARSAAEALRRETAARFERAPYEAAVRDYKAKAEAAEQAAVALAEQEAGVKTSLDAAKRKLAAAQVDVKHAEDKKKNIDIAETELDTRNGVFRALTEKVLGLQLELQSPRRVQIPQDASPPRPKDTKKQRMMTAAAVVAGFALVAGLLVGHEFLTRKVSSLAELQAGGPPVVGVVPYLPDAAALDPVKRADVAEAIDRLRATVAQEWLGRGPATVVVTSALSDEGKAFTAYRLATSLAQAGVRTLLADFDLRNPSLHAFAGVPNVGGVADILRGEADAREGQIILPSGLVFLPAGDHRTTDDAGVTSAAGAFLDPLLYHLRTGVDCLVLHGHGLLAAADTVELARRADVVLLCALYRDTRLPLAQRAADRVATMAGPAAGVVYVGATRHEALC